MTRLGRQLAALAVALLAACAPVQPGGDAEAVPDLLPSLQVYTSGEQYTFVLQVLNTTGSAIDLTFPSGQRYDFSVSSGNREIWRWSEGMSFTQAISNERVDPGETLRFEAMWTPAAAPSEPLTVVGALTASGSRVEQSALINPR